MKKTALAIALAGLMGTAGAHDNTTTISGHSHRTIGYKSVGNGHQHYVRDQFAHTDHTHFKETEECGPFVLLEDVRVATNKDAARVQSEENLFVSVGAVDWIRELDDGYESMVLLRSGKKIFMEGPKEVVRDKLTCKQGK